jgi:hypothetical protein
MHSTNGHGPKRAILYARVSTDEQPRSGYSLAQQLEALREYESREGYEILEEVQDPGQSGASLERPGMDHVRDSVAAGGISAFEELKQLISPELAKCLDPSASYGVWWFNCRRRHRTRVAENGPDGKSYRRRSATVLKPRGEWIAVPVPDSGIPREWVDATREAIRDNWRPSSNGRRFWELSGRILFCGGCGRSVTTAAIRGNGGRSERLYFYYRCHSCHNEGSSACEQAKSYRAEEVEAQVWEAISRLFTDSERLRADLERMIDLEREGMRGDPESEAKAWCDKLAEADRKRSGFQDMAADGLITFDELRGKLAALEETRAVAEREAEASS